MPIALNNFSASEVYPIPAEGKTNAQIKLKTAPIGASLYKNINAANPAIRQQHPSGIDILKRL